MSDADPHRLRTAGLNAHQIVDRIQWHQARIAASAMYRDGAIEHAHNVHAMHVAHHEQAIKALLATDPVKETTR